ncbi:uncharacterized protein LOC114520477 [Dendronephthya gigantea]|uniref:uncharacterized protein LOC114520477 n=1 Tax=Dendronephthya gigantea TaxID=151771 RepID=UPI00106A2C9C|nr:uncharacterized protein LOC114520477 [Dendronephthya gigantea]
MDYDFELEGPFVIFASELASAIDQHPYKPREETIFGVWKRYDRQSFAFYLGLAHADEVYELCKKYVKDRPMRNPLPDEIDSHLGRNAFINSLKEIFLNLEWRSLRQKIMTFVDTKKFHEVKEKVLLSQLGETERVNQAIVNLCSEEKKSVKEKVEEVCQTITKETGKTVDKVTQDALAHKLRRDRGTVLEAKTVTEFAVASGKDVRREPAKSYRKHITCNDLTWVLVGRVDARDEATIVEVKNRTRRFMCPDYDVLQLQAYMFLCDKSKGILLERLRGENKETPFEFNESYWNEAIVPAMYEFVRDLEERVIMSRSILDGVTPPVSPQKRVCNFEVESPRKVARVELGSPIVLQGSSWENKVHSEDNEVHHGGNKAHQGVDEACPLTQGVLQGSSWDDEPSSDLGINSSHDGNDSFALYLSPSDTESDEELANMPLDHLIEHAYNINNCT